MTSRSGACCAPAAARRVIVANKKGLHARAAAKFVKLAASFDAEIVVVKNDMIVSGSSIMGLMMLAAAKGCELELRAMGPGASDAVTALARLVVNRFDED